MIKKLSLDETWEKCLRMWKWIDERWDGLKNVDSLKAQYNGVHDLSINCHFCMYTFGCAGCAGRLVDPGFSCYNKEYCYDKKPKEFYQKLLELNAVRLSSRCLRFVRIKDDAESS